METPGTDEASTEQNTPLSETQDNSQGNEDTGDVNSSTGPSVACSSDTPSTDVLCDSCIESPSRALKSCLTCLVSYCGAHLRPHLEKTKFQNHRLVEPLPDIECRTCEVHRLPLDLFCLLDECCVCQECDVQGHKEHTTASVGDTRRQFEMDLQQKQAEVVKTISAAEKAICKLQSNNVAIETSVAGILTVVEQQFATLQTAVEEARRGVVEELECERRRALRQAEGIQAHLEQKRAELKKTVARMEKLARNKTDVDFLEKYSHWRKGMVDVCLPGWYISLTDHQASFCSVVADATQELCDHIRSCYMEKLKICKNGIKTIINAPTTESQPSPLPHPDTREDFLKYKSHLTFDPDTAHHFLRLTEDNRKVTNTSPWQHSYPDNPARFEYWRQAMTSESLYLGRRYIEVELVGEGAHVGVTYKSIDRKLEQSSSCITGNDFSWCLGRNRQGFSTWHAGVETPLEVTEITRVGLYIDFEAGTVAFYNVTGSGTMTLLHEYKAHFMEPLYATVWLSKKDNMVSLISTTT